MRRIAFAFALSTGLAGCRAPTAPPRPAVPDPVSTSISAARRAEHVASFDAMWDRVSNTYFHPKRLTGEVNWEGVRDTYRPRVEAADSDEAARTAMNAALATLGETHFGILPNEARSPSASESAGYIGLSFREIDGGIVVYRVDENSPAEATHIRPGWRLAAIADTPIGIKPPRSLLEIVHRVTRAERAAAGRPGAAQTLRFSDENGDERVVHPVSARPPAERVATLGNLPPMDLRVESRTLAGGVGYFALSVFMNPPRVMPAFQSFIEQHAQAPGIVIDLRGNPGGLGAMATGLCGFLVDQPGLHLGTMTTRDGTVRFVVNPRVPSFRGKVAVLVDEMSMSTSEILAGGLQDIGRARVFGQRTPGAALPSTVARLPNGDLFQYAVADYVSADEQRLEGVGVTPDTVISLTIDAVRSGRDEALDSAIAWIVSAE